MVIIVGFIKEDGMQAEKTIAVPMVKAVKKKEKQIAMRAIAEAYVEKDRIAYVMEVSDATFA